MFLLRQSALEKPSHFIELIMIKLISLDTVQSLGGRPDRSKTNLPPGMGCLGVEEKRKIHRE
jgi:hypothetical protein